MIVYVSQMFAPYLGAARVHFKLDGPSALVKAIGWFNNTVSM